VYYYADCKAGINLKSKVLEEIFSWIKVIIFAVIFALFINQVVIVNASVPTGSMENNIMAGDRIVAFRLAYLFDEPKRFDIVVFPNPDDVSTLFVKRVIGLPGETLEVKDGKVYIDGALAPLDDSFVKEEPRGDYGPYVIPEGSYFMMGDNRNLSKDSRAWINKYVSEDDIMGKVVFSYFSKFRIYRSPDAS